jgi:hypothetical protein
MNEIVGREGLARLGRGEKSRAVACRSALGPVRRAISEWSTEGDSGDDGQRRNRRAVETADRSLTRGDDPHDQHRCEEQNNGHQEDGEYLGLAGIGR